MTRTQRRTDLWLTLIALALLVLAPVQNAFANDLPELLPPSIRDDAPRWFAALLALMIFVDLALVLLRRALSADPRRQ